MCVKERGKITTATAFWNLPEIRSMQGKTNNENEIVTEKNENEKERERKQDIVNVIRCTTKQK